MVELLLSELHDDNNCIGACWLWRDGQQIAKLVGSGNIGRSSRDIVLPSALMVELLLSELHMIIMRLEHVGYGEMVNKSLN